MFEEDVDIASAMIEIDKNEESVYTECRHCGNLSVVYHEIEEVEKCLMCNKTQ